MPARERGHQGERGFRRLLTQRLEVTRALDHDLATKAELAPVGILEVDNSALDLTLSSSAKTSDLLAAAWAAGGSGAARRSLTPKELAINADNGSESNGKRSQFLARLVRLADAHWLVNPANLLPRPTTASTT